MALRCNFCPTIILRDPVVDANIKYQSDYNLMRVLFQATNILLPFSSIGC